MTFVHSKHASPTNKSPATSKNFGQAANLSLQTSHPIRYNFAEQNVKPLLNPPEDMDSDHTESRHIDDSEMSCCNIV